MSDITKDQLIDLLEYRDGKVFWKRTSGNRLGGSEAGSIYPDGYKRVRINRKSYAVHRVVFLMHHGFLPEFLDHINNDKIDNRIDNLRPATISQNNHNIKTPKHNTSGIKGVLWDKSMKKWRAQTKLHRKTIYLGCFADIELAELVVVEARKIYHGQYANNG